MIRNLILALILLSGCQSRQANENNNKILFSSVSQEHLQPTKWDVGDTTITNEDRLDLFQNHIKGVGGGYIGVGSSQNLSLAAWAKSRWVWLMDFTRIVVAVNKINIAFIRESKTPAEFRQLWKKNSKKRAHAIIKKYYDSQKDYRFTLASWHKSRPFQQRRFRHDDITTKKHKFSLWLHDKKLYDYIRSLALKGRIMAIRGDLKGKTTVDSISKIATKMGIVLRVIYYSNAEEYFNLDGQFRKNWMNVPVDEKSMIVRTISVDRWHYPWAPGSALSTNRGFHYNIQPAMNYIKWLQLSRPGLRTRHILKMGKIDKKNGFSIVDAGPAG